MKQVHVGDETLSSMRPRSSLLLPRQSTESTSHHPSHEIILTRLRPFGILLHEVGCLSTAILFMTRARELQAAGVALQPDLCSFRSDTGTATPAPLSKPGHYELRRPRTQARILTRTSESCFRRYEHDSLPPRKTMGVDSRLQRRSADAIAASRTARTDRPQPCACESPR